MYEIIKKIPLNPSICKMVISAPEIAKNAEPGQFIVLRASEKGERIPLTICDSDPGAGTITIIFQVVGKTTSLLYILKAGDFLTDLLGPLGHPTQIEKYGKVVCVAGGVGTAEIFPVARALQKAGNEVSVIIGARSKDILILVDEIKSFAKEVAVTTDDGTFGRKGFVTEALSEMMEKGSFDKAFISGPIPMMKAVSALTKKHNLSTTASLDSNMVDATGMCGACRVTVAGKMKFTCVDGPEFDAHQIDFDELAKRRTRFIDEEKQSLGLFKKCCEKCLK